MQHALSVISFNDPIRTPAGTVGRIRAVVLDRSRRKLRALILRRGLLHTDVVLPMPLVRPPEDKEGRLHLSDDGTSTLAVLPHTYTIDDVAAALDQVMTTADDVPVWPFDARDLILLRTGQPLNGPDEPLGTLQRIVVQWPNLELLTLIVCAGRMRRRCLRVPQTSIVGWAGEQIYVDITQADVQALPEYRPDSVLRTAIDQALHGDEGIRRTDDEMIAVDVSDGCVTLTGHLADGRNRDRAETLVRQIRGVRGVVNQLISDAQLTHDIAQAFMHLDSASRASVGFSVRHGIVTVFGVVRDAHVRQTVERIVAEIPHIRMAFNEITTPDVPEAAAERQTHQPRRGQAVFARDHYVGRVAQVVLDPRLRQVTAILVDDLASSGADDRPTVAPHQQRMLVLPIHTVKTTSPDAVFLELDRQSVAQAEVFRAKAYVVPPVDWKPPFPYQSVEVMFHAHRGQPSNTTADVALAYQAEAALRQRDDARSYVTASPEGATLPA